MLGESCAAESAVIDRVLAGLLLRSGLHDHVCAIESDAQGNKTFA